MKPQPAAEPATFLEAFESAAARFGPDRWEALQPKQRTAAIYEEMRRIDTVRFAPDAEGRAGQPGQSTRERAVRAG